MGLDTQGQPMTPNKCVNLQINTIHTFSEKRPCTQRCNPNSKSTRGHTSVKLQYRVMGLIIKGIIITVKKCVKFQNNSIHNV